MEDRRVLGCALFIASLLCVSAPAFAHIERPSYWPDPAPDASVKPAAGGAVPKARSLASALARGSKTLVVCKPDSLVQVRADLAAARTKGYRLRPTQPLIRISARQARRLRSINR